QLSSADIFAGPAKNRGGAQRILLKICVAYLPLFAKVRPSYERETHRTGNQRAQARENLSYA
ncbi:MAG: hypothetical protein KBH45_14630, partial [Verrucomicrobia bacterium]|nr:hypothetical protein [Verrucomicrobiota bacterium]